MRKKLYFLGIVAVVLIVFLVKGGYLSCLLHDLAFITYKNETDGGTEDSIDDNRAESENTEDKSETGDITEDARYKCIPIVSKIKDKEEYYNYSNEKYAWWFKRNDTHEPSGCDDALNLAEYSAYYVDYRALNGGVNATPTDASSSLDEKIIYLTFDCGYENGYTEQILDVLREENVPACFFVTKTYIRDNVALTKRMKEEGHQVGNHTITHPSLPAKSYEEIIEEIEGTADYMKEVTGYDMDPYLRPPMGEYSARTLTITRDLGYKTIFWSMAYLDYDVNKQPGADYVIKHFEKYHHSGAIVLMHNVSESNKDALGTVIKNLKKEGYRFASLNELP